MSTSKNAPEGDPRAERPPAVPAAVDALAVPDFRSFMRQVFPDDRLDPDGVARPPAPLRRDYDTAFTLLQRASEAFPTLLRHCQRLEAEMRGLQAEMQAELRAAKGEVQQWQQVAVAMKMHIDETDHEIAILRKRLATAEEQMINGQKIAAAAEQQASWAVGITTLFHDKIVDAFGVGSAAHETLDRVARGELRDGEDPGREIR